MPAMMGLSVSSISSTFMGICGWSDEIEPIRAEPFSKQGGVVDLVACRPDAEKYDMDFSAFALRASMDNSVLMDGVEKLKTYAEALKEGEGYDVVLFDHRTGFNLSAVPIIQQWPGSVVVNIRLDGLSNERHSLYRSLFSVYPETPGAFVSFSLDPEATSQAIEKKHIAQIDGLLNDISENLSGPDSEPLPDEVLKTFWINWFHDRAYLRSAMPPLDSLSRDNLSAISNLREVLELSGSIEREHSNLGDPNFSLSGANAADLFVETRSIRNLFKNDSPFKYIFGRKGTGKTRLFARFIGSGLAEPLLATNDFPSGGVKSNSIIFNKILESVDGDYQSFWWALLSIAIEAGDTRNIDFLESAVDNWVVQGGELCLLQAKPAVVAEKLKTLDEKRFFVIDGVETAVSAKDMKEFVESLFMFLLSLQSDKGFSHYVDFRLFLRSDLQAGSVQNVEQQIANKTVELYWDRDAIFNFLLAKILVNDWFKSEFGDQVEEVAKRLPDIKSGSLSESEYKLYLHGFFPEKIRRNNLLTYTFFKTYFSDTSGDKDGGASFYPRLFERFLFELESLSKKSKREAIVDGKVNHLNMLEAHSLASLSFMQEITQELYNVLYLDENVSRNRELVDQFVSLFEGCATPFKRNEMARNLQGSLDVDLTKIKTALESMKKIGVFEERTGYPGEWRAGGLYKHGLKMKYVR